MGAWPKAERFLATLREQAPLFARQVDQHAAKHPERFYPLAEQLIGYAEATLKDETYTQLVDGYAAFALDVTRAQAEYERDGHYRHRSYADIKREVYDTDYMTDYHWGMFATLFCWEHHLDLMDFFRNQFVANHRDAQQLLDLGCGSGAWSLVALATMRDAQATLVDITPRVVEQTGQTVAALGLKNVTVVAGDALSYAPRVTPDAIISCYVAAHLEQPERYFSHIASLLQGNAQAFLIVAISAAESDHIYEFTSDRHVVEMVEAAGLQVVSSHHAFAHARPGARYTPSSLALIVRRA